MIALHDLCVIERPVRSMLESNFINTELSKLDLSDNAKSFCKEAFDAGLLCPMVKIKDKQVVLNFGIDKKYVRFDISNSCTLFTYGTLGSEPKHGIISDIKKQLHTLSEFIFPKSKVKY